MSQFHVTDENSEDTFDSADTLQEAIRIAREVARQGRAGELICVEHEGKNIRQFVRLPNGEVEEKVLV